MDLPEPILELENRSLGDDGEPTLGPALELAWVEWQSGNRDRELRLHLLFLIWYCNLEPEHITGLEPSRVAPSDLGDRFQEVYQTFTDGLWEDAECLYVVGLMAHLTPWLLGEDVETWEARAAAFRARYRELRPAGLAAAELEGCGAYGDYFAGQLRAPAGY